MFNLLKNHLLSVIIALLIIMALLAVAWLAPSVSKTLWIILLVYGLAIAVFTIVKRNRGLYLQEKISGAIFLRNVIIEIMSILLTIFLASLLGRYMTEIATSSLSQGFIKFVAGIFIGLLVGIAIGISMKQLTLRLVETS